MLYPVAFTLLRELSHPIILSQVHFVLGFVHAYFNIVNYIKKYTGIWEENYLPSN